jgi:hypothetical protein
MGAAQMLQVKPINSRQLRSGAWVIVAYDAAPLVLSGEMHAMLSRRHLQDLETESPLLWGALHDAGYLTSQPGFAGKVPVAPMSKTWRTARFILWAAGIVLVPWILWLSIKIGIPHGADVISAGPHPIGVLMVAVSVAIGTAIPHELAHMFFGRSRRGQGALSLGQAVATTELSHVWAWPVSPRFAAVAAGLVVDALFLVVFLTAWHIGGSQWPMIAATIVFVRMVWQLRVHRNCDGRHLLKLLLDDPAVEVEAGSASRGHGSSSASRGANIWRICSAIGVLVELLMAFYWLIPALLRLIGAI